MMTLPFAFWILVIIFAVIGAMRGWARELLVMFSVILSIFLLNVLGTYIPPLRAFLSLTADNATAFWIRTIVVILMVFFGYQTPNLPRIAGARFARERLSDVLLGFFLGALNGYLIIGTLWFFLDVAKYAPLKDYISAPAKDLVLLHYLPPVFLGIPAIYFAVALAFIFVLVVFI
jgi:uncharacterized membrane protein required for colicin V production